MIYVEKLIETAEMLGTFFAELIIALFFCKRYLEKYFKRTDVAKMLPKQNKIDIEITERLEYTKELLNASRILIYEFHNGEHYSNYRSAYRFSCTYEAVKAGCQAIRYNSMCIPIACMPKLIESITNKERVIVKDLNDIKDTMPSSYAYKVRYDIEAFYDIAIKNKKGEVVGFVAIQWNNKEDMVINDRVVDKLVWLVEEKLLESV